MRIILIPAVLNTPLRQRGVELGIALAVRHRVVVLNGDRQRPGLSPGRKVLWHLRQAFTWSSRQLRPGCSLLRLPALPRWPRLSSAYQSGLVRLLAAAWRCDAVLTQSASEIRVPRRAGRTIVYDILDDHAAGWELAGRPEVAAAIRSFMRREIAKAVAVTASSRVLQAQALSEFGRDAVLVPNGVEVAAFRAVPAIEVARLRDRLGIGAGPVLGFTGGLDAWVDAPLAIAALWDVRRDFPAAQLLVVGDGMRAEEFRAGGAVVTGFVPPDAVPAHVALFNVGLVPFVRSALTDAMLPIKVFDYAAARRPVVATPLAAYDGEDLPFLTVAEGEPRPFAGAIVAALSRGWLPAWDASVDRYDWGVAVRTIEGLLARPS